MLIDGSIIMAIGMGTVFSFLGIMVAMMQAIACLMKNSTHVTTQPADLNHDLSEREKIHSEELAVVLAAARAYAEGDRS